MNRMDIQNFQKDLPEFREKSRAFYCGEMSKADYKAVSGYYGSYAQRDGQTGMLRLRIPAGRLPLDLLAFLKEILERFSVHRMHFTTCQTIQLHDLSGEDIANIIEEALNVGIIPMGGGGDYPRNVMCSPLSGVEKGEYFDVLPWAEAAGDYLLTLIKAQKMPRKLKVGFSNSPANLTHATYRDLGFAARPDGLFDVYSAGGLGKNPCFGVKAAEAVDPRAILYYIKAMHSLFCQYGNYENRNKSRTRFLQEKFGGPTQYAEAFQKKLKEILTSGENLYLSEPSPKTPASVPGRPGSASLASVSVPNGPASTRWGSATAPNGPKMVSHFRVLEQKQPGLYSVLWHPPGGQPDPAQFIRLTEHLSEIPSAEIRLSPDQTAYIINLTAEVLPHILEITDGGAETAFETSVACIGAATCQIGLRDSQALLAACIRAVREACIPADALPQIHISGCPSSCGTHQTGRLGFRGAGRFVDGRLQPGYMLYLGGCQRQGTETMGTEMGVIPEEDIPKFLVELGRAVSQKNMSYDQWESTWPDAARQMAKPYISAAHFTE